MSKMPSSSIMTLHEAQEISASFGESVAYHYDTMQLTYGKNFAFPATHLKHSKSQIQTALGILIAGHAIETAFNPSKETIDLSNAAIMTAGHLIRFTEKHEHPDLADIMVAEQQSMYILSIFKSKCESCLRELRGNSPTISWEDWEKRLERYWQKVDSQIPNLLKNETMRMIRET